MNLFQQEYQPVSASPVVATIVLTCLSWGFGVYIWLAIPAAETGYRLLPTLPFAFGSLLLLRSATRDLLFHPAMAVTLGFMALRYVAMPVILVGKGLYDPVGTIVPFDASMDAAYALMLYEMLGIFGVMFLVAPCTRWDHPTGDATIPFDPFRSPVVLHVVVVLGAAVAIAMPEITSNYRWFASAAGIEQAESATRSGGIGYMILLVEWSRILVCLLAFNTVWTWYRRRPRAIHVYLSAAAFLPLLLFSSRSSRNSILFPSLAACLLLVRLYPNRRRAIIAVLAAPLAVVIGTISIAKNFGDHLLEANIRQEDMLPRVVHAYAAPAHGVAIALETRNAFAWKLSSIDAFIADSTANIPFLGRLIDARHQTTTAIFNITAYGRDLGRDQVIPMLGQGLYHWGPFAAPIYSILTALLAFSLARLAMREHRPEFIFLHTLVMCRMAAGPVLGNWSISLGILVTTWLPLFTLLTLNRRLASSAAPLPA